MSGSVAPLIAFDYSVWSSQYPQFSATVTEAVAQNYFTLAQTYCPNDGTGPITDATVGGALQQALYLLTAHLAQLFSGATGAPATGAVGRVASAGEGSVSVNLELPAATSPYEGWLMQTQYGLMYLAMLGPYRNAQWIPGPDAFFGPGFGSFGCSVGGYGGYGGGWGAW